MLLPSAWQIEEIVQPESRHPNQVNMPSDGQLRCHLRVLLFFLRADGWNSEAVRQRVLFCLMSTDPDSEETAINIIPINESVAQSLEFTQKTNSVRPCIGVRHHLEVDEMLRTIRCLKCGHVLDPFDYILEWAKICDREVSGLSALRIQKKIMQAEHDDLERKVANLRATLKRHGNPQPKAEMDHFNLMRWNPEKANQLP